MTKEDIKPLPAGFDLEYSISRYRSSNVGDAISQLKALQSLEKLVRDSAGINANAAKLPSKARKFNEAIKRLKLMRLQFILESLSAMSSIQIPEEEFVILGSILTE